MKNILNRFESAKKMRSNWETLWQECYDYALPQRGGFTHDLIPGTRRTDKIYDGTALDAVDQHAASLLSNLPDEGDLQSMMRDPKYWPTKIRPLWRKSQTVSK